VISVVAVSGLLCTFLSQYHLKYGTFFHQLFASDNFIPSLLLKMTSTTFHRLPSGEREKGDHASSAATAGNAVATSSSPQAGTVTISIAGESTLPLYQTIGLACVYMFGSILLFLLIRYSKRSGNGDGGSNGYDSTAAVFFMELFKWTFSVAAMYHRTGKFLPLSVFRDGSWRVGLYYLVPSGIYAVYNNLTYYNLSNFEAGTYQVFMQTRILFTGVLYTAILHRPLTRRKWGALLLLTVGVAAKYVDWTAFLPINVAQAIAGGGVGGSAVVTTVPAAVGAGIAASLFDWHLLVLLFQASLSAFAGVYNEFLLKRDVAMDVNEANFFMYSFALVLNLAFGMWNNPTYYSSGRVFSSFNGVFLWIVVVGGFVGISTSLILKFLNVIVKAFASACEVLLTAVLASMFLGEPAHGKDLLACVAVMVSIYIYYTVPSTTAVASGGAGGGGQLPAVVSVPPHHGNSSLVGTAVPAASLGAPTVVVTLGGSSSDGLPYGASKKEI
jgi:drug/metabolite transporter (DMT)-like permease